MRGFLAVLLWCAFFLGGAACALDSETASALATSAATLNEQGKPEKARNLCFRALALDPNCAEALYELGKIYEVEGKSVEATDFMVQAVRQLSKAEKSDSALAAKLADARKRSVRLNPYATRLASILEDYAQQLGGILKTAPDRLAEEECLNRSRTLELAKFVAPDRLPAFEKSAGAATAKRNETSSYAKSSESASSGSAAAGLPLDIERALKQAGWSTISGSWKKVGTNTYEVTDGKLETAKTNGAINVILHQGGTGTLSMYVRNGHKDPWADYKSSSSSSSGGAAASASSSGFGSSYEFHTGYGLVARGQKCAVITPSNAFINGQEYSPSKHHDEDLAGPKNALTVNIMGSKLELYLNAKRVNLSTYKIGNEGPFTLSVKGTLTIENPQAAGQ